MKDIEIKMEYGYCDWNYYYCTKSVYTSMDKYPLLEDGDKVLDDEKYRI